MIPIDHQHSLKYAAASDKYGGDSAGLHENLTAVFRDSFFQCDPDEAAGDYGGGVDDGSQSKHDFSPGVFHKFLGYYK